MKIVSINKTLVAAIAIALALIFVSVGATYAIQDYMQLNNNGLNDKYKIELVEDSVELDDWRVDDGEIAKRISVANLSQPGEEYKHVFVRLQLKEYMDISKVTATESDKRYMTDTEGWFIWYWTLEAAQWAVSNAGPYPGHSYAQLTDAVTGTTGYFIESMDHSPNGQMGKHMVTGVTTSDPVKVIASGPGRASNTNNHGSGQAVGGLLSLMTQNGECDYAIHSFMPGAELETREYIDWRLGADVITFSEWLDPAGPYKGLPVAKWIIDDSAANGAQGWVYWGQALEPGGDVTSPLLESVRLIKQPGGNFYYVVHADMEAALFEAILDGNVDWGAVGNRFKQNAP